MNYGVLLGSNMMLGASGVLTVVEDDGKAKDFFRLREIDRARSEGAYIVVDCDIKDVDNNREIKLAKSKPVATSKEISVECTKVATTVVREDGSLVIKVELLSPDDESIPTLGPPKMREQINKMINELDAVIRITGSFYAGSKLLVMDNDQMKIDQSTLACNIKSGPGAGGISISSQGISF